MSVAQDPRLKRMVAEMSYPMVFATISGAHLYGFPSPDSDYDLRGTHVLPLRQVVGLAMREETVERGGVHEGLEMDIVSHDIRKFVGLMLKNNGYVLEQLYSPLVVHTTPEHEELKEIGKDCITRHHAHHYLGFARTQWQLFEKENPRRVKPLLYVYRVLLTGIHLMRTAEVEANLVTLNEGFRLPYIGELIERKTTGAEKGTLPDGDMAFHEWEYQRLRRILEGEREKSSLPEQAAGRGAINDLLIRIRLADHNSLESKVLSSLSRIFTRPSQ
ncbi:MAG: DNA polymerase beta superfamily protein [Tepidisphaerales bacterium]